MIVQRAHLWKSLRDQKNHFYVFTQIWKEMSHMPGKNRRSSAEFNIATENSPPL